MADRICRETGAQLLSVDGFTEYLFASGCPGREKRLAAEDAVLSFFLDLAAANAEQGRGTVIDHGFWRKCELEKAIAYLESRGIAHETVTVTADFDTRLARVRARKNAYSFDREKLMEFDEYFEE